MTHIPLKREQKDRFEAYVRKRDPNGPSYFERTETGFYAAPHILHDWNVWQAALLAKIGGGRG